MTAATITTSPEGVLAEDNVTLTLSDGETYTTGLSTVETVQVTPYTVAAHAGSAVNLSYSVSGQTITFVYKVAGAAVTDKVVSLTVKGRL